MPDANISLTAEREQEIHIRVDEIPDELRDSLAAATLDLIHAILRQPGGREMLDARTAKRKAERG